MSKFKMPQPDDHDCYTKKQILSVLKSLKIHHMTFWKKFGINTCISHPVSGETLFFQRDVIITIRCCLENRNMTLDEWD